MREFDMRKGGPVIIIGAIILVLGIIFHLQGHSIVGPQSSFMYSNPEWITYGLQIVVAGLIIMIVGGILAKIKK